MPEEHFQCPECSKYFGSEDTFKEHARIEHPDKTVKIEDDEPLIDLNGITGNFRSVLNLSFALGLMLGIVAAGAAFTGYSYWDSLEQRTEVPVTVVTCEDCSYDKFQSATERLFKADYREVDHQSDEGQALIDEYGISYVPAFIVDRSLEETEKFYRIEHNFIEHEDAYVLPDLGNPTAQRLSDGRELEQ